jgi:hypothetical protein
VDFPPRLTEAHACAPSELRPQAAHSVVHYLQADEVALAVHYLFQSLLELLPVHDLLAFNKGFGLPWCKPKA